MLKLFVGAMLIITVSLMIWENFHLSFLATMGICFGYGAAGIFIWNAIPELQEFLKIPKKEKDVID
ncbi:hypothetical protein KKA24_02300 [Patescibacteria group bacterium]|nr:hypothetical protein [Patescibacteria group bacterium]